MMLNAISFCSFVLASGVDRSSCIRAADEVISATPSNLQVSATTSRSYKRHLAQHLCGVSESMTALELGIYHGHTTAVLASMFKKVIAVDLKQEFLKKAADTLGKLERKVVFLEMDLFVDGWSLFAGNRVDVVVIDANHGYEYVRADAENALRYLPHLKYLVFHDTWTDEVERAVTELESAGVMSCQNIGLGADGKEYDHREWDPQTNRTWFVKQTRPEGKVCENRHTQISGKAIAPNFWEKLFLLYKQPVTTLGMCSAGFFRFEANGVLKAGVWSEGTWKMSNVSHDMLLIRLPKMSPRPMEIHFNVDRSAFLLTQMGHTHADWFGILDQMVQRPFHLADGMF